MQKRVKKLSEWTGACDGVTCSGALLPSWGEGLGGPFFQIGEKDWEPDPSDRPAVDHWATTSEPKPKINANPNKIKIVRAPKIAMRRFY